MKKTLNKKELAKYTKYCDKIIALNTEELLEQVNKLFTNKENSSTYQYTLGKNNRGYYCFKVVDNWCNWLGRGLEIYFVARSINNCLRDFLLYVKCHNISVKRLQKETVTKDDFSKKLSKKEKEFKEKVREKYGD